MDVGALTPSLGLRRGEKLMNSMSVFRSSYAYAYIRPGGVAYDANWTSSRYMKFLTPLQKS